MNISNRSRAGLDGERRAATAARLRAEVRPAVPQDVGAEWRQAMFDRIGK